MTLFIHYSLHYEIWKSNSTSTNGTKGLQKGDSKENVTRKRKSSLCKEITMKKGQKKPNKAKKTSKEIRRKMILLAATR